MSSARRRIALLSTVLVLVATVLATSCKRRSVRRPWTNQASASGSALGRENTTAPTTHPARDTCAGPYPNYFQDPQFAGSGMWAGQTPINVPPDDTWRVFKLSQAFPQNLEEEDSAAAGWLAFNPFNQALGADDRSKQARRYLGAVMEYLQAGNVEQGSKDGNAEEDWSLCHNRVRAWFHVPWQTYDPLSGREYLHGLTREAPVTFTLVNGEKVASTVWAIAFYNARGGYQLGRLWKPDGSVAEPLPAVSFPEGTVVGKLLFTTLTPDKLPNLSQMPTWTINRSSPEYCECESGDGSACSLQAMTEQCPRALGTVTLMQFDIAVKDSRAAPTGWVFGTFVADGLRKAGKPNPWDRLSPVGLMWGNDPPPPGKTAREHPGDAAHEGFAQAILFPDTVKALNEHSDAGHLGCNGRLNGPVDNSVSSCLSCHQTASVPDLDQRTPVTVKHGGAANLLGQCQQTAEAAQIDAVYFGNLASGAPFSGPPEVVPAPRYPQKNSPWSSLDYSLQLSIGLAQYRTWQQHAAEHGLLSRAPAGTQPPGTRLGAPTGTPAVPLAPKPRRFSHALPAR